MSEIPDDSKAHISYKVMKMADFDTGVFYKVDCSCGDDDDITTIEIDCDYGILSLNFYKKLEWSAYWGDRNFFERIWHRIKGSLKMLFTGYVYVEGSTIMQSNEHIDNFIAALEEGKQKMNKCSE